MSRILYVDDNRDMRELIPLILRGEGYDVITAAHGQEALILLQSNTLPDLILLDHNMDIMSGPEFLDELELNHSPLYKSIPIVLMTAMDRDAVKTKKATEVFTRKGDLSAILAMVKKYCSK